MSQIIRALLALDNDVDKDATKSLLAGSADVRLVGMVNGLDDGWGSFEQTPSDVLVVACGGDSEVALSFIDRSVRQRPDRPVVVLCGRSANGFVNRVFEAGADDIVTLPDWTAGDDVLAVGQVAFALQKAVARKNGSAGDGSTKEGRAICILGPKGGIGKSLTATNLSVTLAEGGQRVVLVDIDLQFGDAGLALGLVPDKTIYDLATSGGALDAEKIEAYLAVHPSGLRALLAPVRPDQAGSVTVEFLRDVLAILRSTNDYVVVDTPPGFTPEVIASIDGSSDVCMVGMLDSLSLKNTKLGLETLELMGYDREHVRLVLNRADSRVGITEEDVVTIVGRQPDVLVPSHREIACSVNEGTPIALANSRSEAARAFRALAGMYSHTVALGSEPEKSGGRRRFRRRG